MEVEDIVLLLMGTLIVIGYGYSMDMPQALEVPLRAQPYNLTSIEFNWLYIATSVPVIFTDIPLGLILDKFPLQKTVIVIAVTSFTAELLTAVLFDYRPQGFIYMVYVLRAIVGMAGSSAFTMQGFVMARYAAQHFQMLMGFGLCVPSIVDALNSMLTPIIYQSSNSISLPWYIASFVDFFAIIAALVIAFIVIRKQKRKKDQMALSLQQEQQEEQQQFKASYLLQMPKIFWLINFTVFGNQVTLNIYGNLNDLIVNRFNIPYTTTGQLLLIPFILGSLFSLLFGKILISKPTLRRKMVLSSNIVITIAMIIFYFLPSLNPNEDIDSFTYIWVVFYLVMFSVFFGSIYTILVSSVSLLADKKRLGTAWGVVGTAIGLGQSVSPLINGLVEEDYDLKGSYKTLSLVYIFLSCFPLILSTMINFGPYNVLDNTFDGAQKSRSIEQGTDSLSEKSDSIVTTE